jgi:N-methylhydantoinase A
MPTFDAQIGPTNFVTRSWRRLSMRLAIDMGGTFTDLVLEDDSRSVTLLKTLTTVHRPAEGMLVGIGGLAARRGVTTGQLLASIDTIVHGTTRATNAILTNSTAKTAFITTLGHPDILLFRMGGREDPFRHDREFPGPYVPRSLTFELDERIDYRGQVIRPLDRDSLDAILTGLIDHEIEAVGVCLLWSVANAAHELEVGAAIAAALPGIHVTLSHRLNPIVREYHRASSACIDASLKPVMSAYLRELRDDLERAGFRGGLLVASVSGGLLEPERLADAPIHSINSGPALAPVAGRHYAAAAQAAETAIVIDAGGTSFDVSVVRQGRIPRTRETWLGERFVSHVTGFPSVDVRTTGSGGGSIASVDAGGLLSVGPRSAGSLPGPACYGRGGTHATVTDAAVLLGFLDGGRLLDLGIEVDVDAAASAIERDVATPLGLDRDAAAAAVIKLVTEQMIHAVEEVTVDQGVDPREAVLVSGGAAAGFNVVAIARRLGCRRLIIPTTSAALSATGGLLSAMFSEYTAAHVTSTARFDRERVNGVLDDLEGRGRAWIERSGLDPALAVIDLMAETRYPGQVWELELPLPVTRFRTDADIESLRDAFHRLHQQVFAVCDPDSAVEIVGWAARASTSEDRDGPLALAAEPPIAYPRRRVHLPDEGWIEVDVLGLDALEGRDEVVGPAILELPGTTVLLDRDSVAAGHAAGAIVVEPARRAVGAEAGR